MSDLNIELAGIKLKNPVVTASGTFGSGKEYSNFIDLNEVGAVVTKTITFQGYEGNPTPRICETPSGMLNSIGLQNKGVEAFVQDDISFLAGFDVPIIASIGGASIDDYCRVTKYLSPIDEISALEINISCPNVKQGGMAFGMDPGSAAELVSKLKTCTSKPLIVKLTPNCGDIIGVAKAVERAGANSISLINTILAMSIDVDKRAPKLATIVGGLSGPAIKPIALRMVWQVASNVEIPVIGIGGISTAEDALEFLIAGASAVGVGTAIFVDPQAPIKIAKGIDEYLNRHGIDSVSDLVGSLNVKR